MKVADKAPMPKPEPCSADYTAEQIPGRVVITASGFHNTSGYKVFFQQSLLDIYPPQFSFWHIFSGGIVLEVITPFRETVQFAAKQRVKQVVVYDANGKHVVPVESAPDRTVKHASASFKKDGPFPKEG